MCTSKTIDDMINDIIELINIKKEDIKIYEIINKSGRKETRCKIKCFPYIGIFTDCYYKDGILDILLA